MRKKFLAIALTAAFCMGALSACGGSDSNDTADTTEAATEAEATTEEATEAEPATEEISFDNGSWKVTAQAPEGSSYVLTEDQPDTMMVAGSVFIDSPKIVGSIGTKTVFGDDKTFDGMIKFITADDYTGTIKDFEELKFGDRDAIKYEYRYGSGEGDLYGYWYYIDFPELYEGCMIEMVVAVADGKPESTEATFADEEVKAFIDSLKFDVSSGEATSTEEASADEAEEATEAAEDAGPVNGGELSDNGVTISVESDTSKGGDWYVDATSFTVYYYNVPTKDDAYSNSPRIQVSLGDQSSFDYYAEKQENVVDIENRTIGGLDLKGKTYSYVGMEWTEYYGIVSGEEYIRIQISDVDIADGTDGANILDNMKIEVK